MEICIRHVTRFRYRAPVSESVMEVRLHPRCEGIQECADFELHLDPPARQFAHQDYLGNIIHSFDIPGGHRQLTITARGCVEMAPPAPLPPALPPDAWQALDREIALGDYYEALAPSVFVTPSALLLELAKEWDIRRRDDPLTLLHEITTRIYRAFKYLPEATQVDSTIDHALGIRGGVCQDFTHIMLALGRQVGIPCRYVSGYLFHRVKDQDRAAEDAMHAWVEAWLPGLGWVGFDPTNNTLAGPRHIRVAVGRDYADVPPTRGVFRGNGDSELSVAVQVYQAGATLPEPKLIRVLSWAAPPVEDWVQAQGQQQQ
jgi:transglutaminase-like putative cysteine protease